ncbi:Tn3 family transposase [Stenotrophomonas sp. NPDC087984]
MLGQAPLELGGFPDFLVRGGQPQVPLHRRSPSSRCAARCCPATQASSTRVCWTWTYRPVRHSENVSGFPKLRQGAKSHHREGDPLATRLVTLRGSGELTGCRTPPTFGTKVIVVTRREAHYVRDEIMGNKTDLPITEHATDTHGVTLVNFALFDLVGMQLSPRIRDLGKITLYRMDTQRDVGRLWPMAGPLLTQKINTGLIEENWDDLLRLAGSIKFGQATASLIVGKPSASSRQNTLTAALKEYGALRRTVYAARYLADETYRRKIARQLNKGESLHSLRRSLLYAHEGAIRHRHLAAQTEQAWCLTLLTNSVVTWTTVYYGLAIAQMRAEGRAVDDELLAHISPAHSENVNFFGTINVEVDTELAKLDPAGYRPLRPRRPDRN